MYLASATLVPLRGIGYARVVPLQVIGAVLGEPAAKKVMGVVVLKCRKCNLVIAPEDPMITISCGSPSKFEKCEISWHARCAPMMVRQYVPETKGGFQLERRECER